MQSTRESIYRRMYGALQRSRVEKILARPEPPRPLDSESVFEELQRQYPARDDYRYDPFSAWWRGAQRAQWLIPMFGIREPGARVLEASCGDGMTGQAFAAYGHDVVLHDLEDWRDGRARHLPFIEQDLCEPLPLEPGSFDVVISYNAFEHIGDPEAALRQLVRVCKPGGLIYLDFGPLYASAWGLHAYRTLHMPYAQFLFSEAFIAEKLKERGVRDLGRDREELQPLNRWTLARFRQTWEATGCKIISQVTKDDSAHLGIIERFPEAFQGRGLTYKDVVASQLVVRMRKPEHE
jgi:SAM-dependent methyltransferase